MSDGSGDDWPHRRWRAMGTDALVIVEPGPDADAVLDTAVGIVAAAEARMSRFRPDSELSRLNAARQATVSEALAGVIRDALALSAETGGRFDPTMLDAIVAAGYDASFDALDRATPRMVDSRPRPGRAGSVEVRGARGAAAEVVLHDGVRLDLGGIGKGATCDAVVGSLRQRGAVLCDLGGDVAVAGHGPADGLWAIGIDHGNGLLGVVTTTDSAVTTSTVGRRRWETSAGPAHHLLHPATGRPARSDVASATVFGPRATRCEAWAKALVVAGLLPGFAAIASTGLRAVVTGALGTVYVCPDDTDALFHGTAFVPNAEDADA